MTLPTSGPLSLSAIQGEFGGSSSISLNAYYAGGANVPSGTVGFPGGVSTPIPSSGQITVNNFYGASKALETHTLTIGTSGGNYGYFAGNFGSLNPTTSSVFGGTAIIGIIASPSWFLGFTVSGFANNSGYTTFTVNGNSFSRASATYNFDPTGNQTSWQWTSGSNPIGTSGTVTVVLT